MNIFNYYPHQIEKNNCLGETELASGKTLKSCEIILKAIFLAECVECTINVWIIDHNYGTSTNWGMHSCVRVAIGAN